MTNHLIYIYVCVCSSSVLLRTLTCITFLMFSVFFLKVTNLNPENAKRQINYAFLGCTKSRVLRRAVNSILFFLIFGNWGCVYIHGNKYKNVYHMGKVSLASPELARWGLVWLMGGYISPKTKARKENWSRQVQNLGPHRFVLLREGGRVQFVFPCYLLPPFPWDAPDIWIISINSYTIINSRYNYASLSLPPFWWIVWWILCRKHIYPSFIISNFYTHIYIYIITTVIV